MRTGPVRFLGLFAFVLLLTAGPILANQTAPQANAGPNQSTPTCPGVSALTVLLEGSVFDDGLPDPPGSVTTVWTQQSGPAAAVLGDPLALQTLVDFPVAGTYVFRLTADDGELTGSDYVSISVNQTSQQLQAVNLGPIDRATSISTDPTFEIVCAATSAVLGQFVVAEDAAFSSIAYDSGASPNYVCSHVAFAGLDHGTEYYWTARIQDGNGLWSEWSAPTRFTTIAAGILDSVSFQDGVGDYQGTRDADIRGSYLDPTTAILEWNQGTQDVLRTGRRPPNQSNQEIYRSLLRFDLTTLMEADAVVNAYLELTGWEHTPPHFFHGANSFFRVLRPWGEGTGLSGVAPGPGEVSWSYSEFPVPWSIPGVADPGLDRESSATIRGRITGQVGLKSYWSSEAFVDLVKLWIAEPAENHGLLIRADDESDPRVINLASREHEDPAYRPRLVIEIASETACLQAFEGDPCDDGNECTVEDECSAGSCVGSEVADGIPVSCGVGECLAPGICIGGIESCTPAATANEICDTLDNDCDGQTDEADALDAATWYEDSDGDSFGDANSFSIACSAPAASSPLGTDCDDSSAATFPGAVEVNDSLDNQCPGDSGFGLVNELSGLAGFFGAGDPARYSWTPQPGATLYEVLRSDSAAFAFGCSAFNVDDPFVIDTPAPQPGALFFYLVRPLDPESGSWGRLSSGLERFPACF